MVELTKQKLERLEQFEEKMRNQLRERIRRLKSHEAALDRLERRLKLKLVEMQEREHRMGIF